MLSLADRFWIKAKDAFLRITFTRATLAFFLFTFLHCFGQGIIQSGLYTQDASASNLVSGILKVSELNRSNFTWLTRHHDHFNLRTCSRTPLAKKQSFCTTIFQADQHHQPSPSPHLTPLPQNRSAPFKPSGVGNTDTNLFAVFDSQSSSNTTSNTTASPPFDVAVLFSDGATSVPVLNSTCLNVLVYADQVLNNSKREELALIGSEFWLLGVSVFGILYDSIPHLLAGFFFRVLSVGWTIYTVWRTKDIQARFEVLLMNGPCQVDIFAPSQYFKNRIMWQIPDVILNFLALVISAYLVRKLVKLYSNVMFGRAGLPPNLLKLYRYFLGVFTFLQLSVYLLVTAVSLWIDQILVGPMTKVSSHTPIYVALFIFTNVMLIPWIAMGWYAVRREMKRTMAAYLLIGFIFLICWGIMYYSQVYRWTWVQWPFFGSVTTAAQLSVVGSIIFGIICWKHFHRGFAQYLRAEQALASIDFEPEVYPNNPKGPPEWGLPWIADTEQTFTRHFSIPELPAAGPSTESSYSGTSTLTTMSKESV